jgi:hypothetical protein
MNIPKLAEKANNVGKRCRTLPVLYEVIQSGNEGYVAGLILREFKT